MFLLMSSAFVRTNVLSTCKAKLLDKFVTSLTNLINYSLQNDMNNSNIQQEKQRFMNVLWAQKTIELSELQHVGENVFALNAIELPADDKFTSSYDQTLGINSSQRAMMKEASGETGLTNYRNYINVASNLQKPK